MISSQRATVVTKAKKARRSGAFWGISLMVRARMKPCFWLGSEARRRMLAAWLNVIRAERATPTITVSHGDGRARPRSDRR